MEADEERIAQAVRNTGILRLPKQKLATFGTTNIHYYLITEPSYSGVFDESSAPETVIREGRVISERPRIVTPYYLSHLEGFGDNARKYIDLLSSVYGVNAPSLLYAYKNEFKELNIVSGDSISVANRLNAELDQRNDPLVSIIKGEDALWDVSLLKFIFELTRSSLRDNLQQMGARGLLEIDPKGVPVDARILIEALFRKVARGEGEPGVLKAELERWSLFEEYQDRFFALLRRRV